MKRRDFLKNTAVLAVAPAVALPSVAAPKVPEMLPPDDEDDNRKLIDSHPMLQNYAPDSMGIAFSVSALANGYVVYGRRPDLADARKVYCGGYRVTGLNADVMLVRLTNLQPATTYYYRIGADRIHYGGGYDMKIIGNEEPERIYSFSTAGADAPSHFCVINDTHAHMDAFEKLTSRLAALHPACVVWNGDATNCEEEVEDLKNIFLRPAISRPDYASCTPYLFAPGNHDSRGMANRHIDRVWMFRQPEERASRDWDLGRNFAVRTGQIAMIGLDTAEDKLDTNPLFARLFSSAAYREAQVAWLRDALQRPDISSAPYLVAFCHIPLFDSNPKSNPGDVAPADADPQYSTDYAVWQRTCANLWAPLLAEARCQLVVCAHTHRYRFDAATPDRPWAQMVGGGPEGTKSGNSDCAAVIDAQVEDGQLVVTAYDVVKNQQIDKRVFAPRAR